ncbi:signal transduction histidine kinase/ActR/RegA family two-component response regulator [Sphingomonas kyeonggiensis]|uniref:histidine kinase n=1 Tax=Sphingomonas kyeonggiensis TaxID=1268553 RepID=A0A7W7K5H7_9SPHN|nr:ATP-binding protein [Sphingomonas kyeonggiensis]MBB4841436.1 signal transduction histidine kinase/ActR/RegA family two-component response regulator [Sphingomonas kyeonggiensis]
MSESNTALERAVRATNWRMALLGALALLGIVVLAAVAVIQARTDAERDRAIARQQHTFEVIMRVSQLSGAILGAEAALGRYVVSADKNLGQQYSAQWGRASEQLNRLRQLLADNPAQQARIVRLKQAFDARGKELDTTALYSSYKRHSDAWGSYYQVRASPARSQLESVLTEMVDAERVTLRQRSQAAADLVANSGFASRLLTGFGILIVLGAVLLGWMAIEAQGERAVADANADAERERAEELQEAVAEATEQLRAEASEREAAQDQLRQAQKMEAVGQLTGGIAHDFNNMLAVVLGGLELAKRHLHNRGPDAQKHIENAMEGANRAAALTRRLLAFSRAEPLLPEAVEAGTLIEGMADLLDRTLGDGIAVTTADAGRHWRIWVDRHQLENALLNLAVNARDAMEGQGTLSINTGGIRLADHQVGECLAGDYVSIEVGDTGQGMTPEVLARVFEPFFTTKPVGKGTGLGLSQIFGFVRQSGGEIGIDTAPGRGTRVTLYLPRHIGEGEAAEASAESGDAPAHIGRPLEILVVEDDPRVLAATLGALKELGHSATGCDDPQAAPGALALVPGLDLIVSDVLMPGQTGPEMIAALGDRIEGVAVLFVTGFAGEADAGIFKGRTVLRKPFTIAGLEAAVNEAMAHESRRAGRAAAE